jgi:hypothetical protein
MNRESSVSSSKISSGSKGSDLVEIENVSPDPFFVGGWGGALAGMAGLRCWIGH